MTVPDPRHGELRQRMMGPLLPLHRQYPYDDYPFDTDEPVGLLTPCGPFSEFTVLLRPRQIWTGYGVRIDSHCKIEGGLGVYIGPRIHVAYGTILNQGGGELFMEEGVGVSAQCAIVTGTNVAAVGRSSSASSPDNVAVRSFVHIKKNAILYNGVKVLPGVTIGEGAVIACGAVVRCDVPDYETWGGVDNFRCLRKGIATDKCEQCGGKKPCGCYFERVQEGRA